MSDEQETKTEAAAPTEEPKKEEEETKPPVVEEPKKKEGEEPPKEEESTATFEPVVSLIFMSVNNIYNIMYVYCRSWWNLQLNERIVTWFMVGCNDGFFPPTPSL